MVRQLEVADPDGLYSRFSTEPGPRWHARQTVVALADLLAAAVSELVAGDRTLCVVILRGGALLYPGFARRLPGLDFLMLGLQREAGRVRCTYRSAIPQPDYDQVLYLDCVAATGGTVLAARAAIAEQCLADRHLAAVLCSSRPATETLAVAGIDLIGFSLYEQVDSGIVSPDLGELDAGDLFSSPRTPRTVPTSLTG